jgi:hypothetical protein
LLFLCSKLNGKRHAAGPLFSSLIVPSLITKIKEETTHLITSLLDRKITKNNPHLKTDVSTARFADDLLTFQSLLLLL